MKRIGTFALIVGIAALTLAVPSGTFAQAQSGAPAVREQARVDELVKYAREKYAEGQAQPAQAQQKTLEERAEARPVMRLTVDAGGPDGARQQHRVVRRAAQPPAAGPVARPDPRRVPADAELDGERQLVHAAAHQPAERRPAGDQRDGERERQHRPDPALVRHELHGGVQQRAHEHDEHVRHAEPAVHDAAHRHDHAAAAAGLQDRQHAATSC